MESEGHRTVPVPAEREYVEAGVRTQPEIVDFVSGECVVAPGIPVHILPYAPLRAAIYIEGVPDRVLRPVEIAVRGEHVVAEYAVSYSGADAGDCRIGGPGLEFQIKLVLEFHHPEGVV